MSGVGAVGSAPDRSRWDSLRSVHGVDVRTRLAPGTDSSAYPGTGEVNPQLTAPGRVGPASGRVPRPASGPVPGPVAGPPPGTVGAARHAAAVRSRARRVTRVPHTRA
ncbi:hypothetical protein EV383_2063 [Pseudonocardia sediminis]|uniref:Uncharacterized protein n=1 Tax=Pseudonocardia sediminis TaxID=1397368 RepID=A0A4Q7UYF3_PSEST|nr:hypothetical protein EV383_2063 [Pseudonocardia sediminis]